jgi:cytoskeleton protein RodZ
MDEHAAKLIPEAPPKVSTFGTRLKREREKRSITLEDVSVSTKISLRMLRALEEERFEQLPGGIFNKGFVRAYARHLGIDEDQAVADYLESAGETMPKVPQATAEIPSADTPDERPEGPANIPWGTLAIALLLIALGLSLWSFYARQANRRLQETPAAQPQPTSSNSNPSNSNSIPANAPSTATGSSSSQGPSAMTGLYASGKSRAGSELDPGIEPHDGSGIAGSIASAGNAIKNLSLVSPDSKPVNHTTKQPGAVTSPFVVLIEAEENSWVSIVADGKVILEGTLIAPAVKSIRAQKQITVKAGNAGGLDFSFNGKRLPAQGASGEVKNLIFDADGLQAPAAKPPS